jgi:Type IIA topoisomerase (DNA gyrase/topo II, topoisomerase IV), B subunit
VKNNLSKIHKPVIVKYNGKPYTKITFIPDYKRFNVDKLSDDLVALMHKRAYDLIAFSNGTIKVSFNDKKLDIEDFNGYISLFIEDTPRLTYLENDRWKIGFCVNTTSNKLEQISSVNGINTRNGGTHVNYIVNQIVKVLKTNFDKKNKSDIKENLIKSTLTVFVFATIENPTFDSQTKETLTTNVTKFGSKCDIPEKLILKLGEMGIYDKIYKLYEFYNNTELNKISGKKKNKIFIEKLEDARFAGTKKSKECKLFLTEGDSA